MKKREPTTPLEAIAFLGQAYQYVYGEATGHIYDDRLGFGPEVHLLPYRVQDALRILQSCATLIGTEVES